ncbi:hypothetical protein BS78_04G321400 [Paspalum vaginatum]|nr:hypothetical protein BS78_04G321400 [Paspalum vaginatum]
MGKKKSGRNNNKAGGDDAAAAGTAFLLRVPMHCRCQGCTDKIRAGVKDLTLHHHLGVQALDQSELATKGELKVFATGDPDKLRRRLHKSTGKTVDLVLLSPTNPSKQQQQQADKDAAAAAKAEKDLIQALLLRGGLQQQQPPPAAQYAHQVLPGYAAYGAAAPHHAASYDPWGLELLLQPQQQQMQMQMQAYPAAAAYHGAYPQPQLGLGGAYGGGGWPGHGSYY